jgi:hypothetical protein
MHGGSSGKLELCAFDWVCNLDRREFTSPDGGAPNRSGTVPPPLQRNKIKAPMHAVLPAVKALFWRFDLSAVLIACNAQLDARMPVPG